MAAIVNGSELILTGTVGGDFWGFEDCFTQSDVIFALAQMGDVNPITIRLNSGGGYAWEGSAIHAAIARRKGNTQLIVEGIAASAASIIAMAGDDVRMSLGAMMMVHDPEGITIGTVKDHQDQISCLTALADSMATIYADKTERPTADCRADMQAETWLTAEDAIAKGYADGMANDDGQDPAEPIEPAPFAYAAYRHPPQHITALADKRRWPKALTRNSLPAASAALTPPKELPMATSTPDPNRTAAETKDTQDQIDAAVKTAVTTATANTLPRADAAEIITLCNGAGVPMMAVALVKEGVTVDAAKARIDSAKDIRAAVDLARKSCPAIEANLADTYLAAGTSLQGAREDLFKRITAAQSPEIAGHHQAGTGNPTKQQEDEAARSRARASMEREIKRRGMPVAKEA